MRLTKEELRLAESRARTHHWKRWGPYLSERAWGTVREDYSANGDAWNFMPHDHARSRAYRWNEDGIGGICDRHQEVCFSVALWNGHDPILKERLYGVTGAEGNHGEDVKEYYYYLDSTPTHSYLKFLYKYPQAAYPYEDLTVTSRRRTRHEAEFELIDTGIFEDNRYFDVFVEYAKADVEDILIRVTAHNRGPDEAVLHLAPTIWFRNTWSWGHHTSWAEYLHSPAQRKPELSRLTPNLHPHAIDLDTLKYGIRRLYCLDDGVTPELLFTENETNALRLFGRPNPTAYVKDGIGRYIVDGVKSAVNPAQTGTKAAAHYVLTIPPGESRQIRLRFTDGHFSAKDFESTFDARIKEADQFYATVTPKSLSPDAKNVMRQAFAGMMWSKQYYHFVVEDWLNGDPNADPPSKERSAGRNHEWRHLYNADVLSMPDKWEYPWYAAWDLAFHCIPIALVDSEFAKQQLSLILREWYMHPNGQLPAYEWEFSAVNPPVHAWAAWRVYRMEEKRTGIADRPFLEGVFHKLLLNFTWWVNRKDADGMNIFEGGFLGLDNIGVFDRSAPLPTGGRIEQSDGTSWMAMYTLNLLTIAFELARDNPVYEDVASKFWEHFLHITHAMNNFVCQGQGLWDPEDGFFYDVLHLPNGERRPMRVRSIVGLIPLFAVDTIEPEVLERCPNFTKRLEWFIEHRPDLTLDIASMDIPGAGERRLLSLVTPSQLREILRVMLDEEEFLSPYGIRALSRRHKDHPYEITVDGQRYQVDYEPGESTTSLFGGNSNWRGPIWIPINYLLIESLQKYHHYLGDDYKVEMPTGSGIRMTLWEVAADLSRRLTRIFLQDENGRRPVHGDFEEYTVDPHWRDLPLFYEYFHGDDGSGLGASHQTGWTGLVAKLLQQNGE